MMLTTRRSSGTGVRNLYGYELGRAAKCPLTHAELEATQKGENSRSDLSRSYLGNLGHPLSLHTPSWYPPQKRKSTLDELLFLPSPQAPVPVPVPAPVPSTIPVLYYFHIMFSDDIYPAAKDYIPQPLYVRQPCSIQIIQLVECSPPPPQQKYISSRLSSSFYSDSQSDGSAYDSSSSSLPDGSSYCSSAEESAPAVPSSFEDRDPSVDDTYRTRQRRVSQWRDAVYSKNDAASGGFISISGTPVRASHISNPARAASPCQKRKTPDGDLVNSDPLVNTCHRLLSI